MNPFALALFVAFTAIATAANADQKGAWSEAVNGVRARLVIGFDPDFAGTEMATVHLEIQNVSDVADPKEIWFDPDRCFVGWQLRDETGKAVPRPGAMVASIITMGPYWITLPYDSTLRLRISVSGYGIRPDGGIALQLPGAFWQVPRRADGRYELSVKFVGSAPKDDARRAWHGTLVLPSVRVQDKIK